MKMNKKELREHMKELRDSITCEKRARYDEVIYKKVINCEYYTNAKILFSYVSFGSEVCTHKIIEHALANNKTVCVPKVINRTEGMKAVKINSLEELNQGNFGVLEPENLEKSIAPEAIDLILIPGLAFDKFGGRLGYGAGYYDSFLKEVKKDALKIALSYSIQILDKVPMEAHDIFIENLITN